MMKPKSLGDDRFTKILTDLALSTKDLAEWGYETGNTTPEKFKLTIAARREAAIKLVKSGMSQRDAAKVLGVSQKTIDRDVSRDDSKSESELLKTRQANEDKRKAELAKPAEIILLPGLHQGDFRELSHKIADDSVQLIFTDPPYDKNSVDLYRDAAAIAARVLKPGGSFIAYSGQKYLPDVLKACSYHLVYWWTIAGVHSGSNQILNRLGVRCGWKPLVWFVKDTRGDVQNVLSDVVSGGREKEAHEWQQSEEEARYYIEKLTTPEGLVADFFVGSGTTAAAAKRLGRKFIGFEIETTVAEGAARRVWETVA